MRSQACKAIKHETNGSGDIGQKREKKVKMAVFRPVFFKYLRDLVSKQQLRYAKKCVISMRSQACKAIKHETNSSGDIGQHVLDFLKIGQTAAKKRPFSARFGRKFCAVQSIMNGQFGMLACLLYTSPSPRDS